MKLAVCITYDEHFAPMCNHLLSNLEPCKENMEIRLNKIDTVDEQRQFQSKSWYENLSQKMLFAMRNIVDASEGQVICVSDADIQFFRPNDLFERARLLSDSHFEYLGQREGGTADENNQGGDFNGGFFLIKKNKNTLDFVRQVCETDITRYRLADQEVINHKIRSMGVISKFLEARKYVHGCCIHYEDYVGTSNAGNIVMHHATCASNIREKMDQMNHVRLKMNFPAIEWGAYV